MKTDIYSLPAYWACALINDDQTGLLDYEAEQIKDFLVNNPEVLHCVGTTEEEQYFSNYRGMGCDMQDYIFAVKEEKTKEELIKEYKEIAEKVAVAKVAKSPIDASWEVVNRYYDLCGELGAKMRELLTSYPMTQTEIQELKA